MKYKKDLICKLNKMYYVYILLKKTNFSEISETDKMEIKPC